MKTAATVFIIIGMIVNFIFGWWILAFIGLGIGIWALVTLEHNQKSIACGVLTLIFAGMIGGILYLCWQPTKE